MEAFATVDDLEARWRPLSDGEKNRAEILLIDATALITRECATGGVPLENASDAFRQALTAVCCAVVRRSMSAPVDGPTVSNASKTAGPFSQSFTYSNASGDMYMSSTEKRELGIGKARIGTIPARIAPYGVDAE